MFERPAIETLMTDLVHAINANAGACPVIESALCRATTLCVEVLNFFDEEDLRSNPHWTVGMAVKPKMRDHPYHGMIGVVRRYFPETDNLRARIRLDVFTPDGRETIDEDADSWMTA